MKNLVMMSGIAMAAALVVAAPASAASVICSSTSGTPKCSFDGESGTLDHTVAKGKSFTDTYHFVFTDPGALDLSFTLAKNPQSGKTLTFTSVVFDGQSFAAVPGENYTFTGLTTRSKGYDLVVKGKNTYTKSLSYSGTIAFSAAVPEPANWALMIGGFGLVGGAMRRRSSFKLTTRFA